jgi:2-polyprenyl-3-methyl-5-hydroxy-6-metoxy-1,4-benzoquinol methylase
MSGFAKYSELRNVKPQHYKDFIIPAYLKYGLPEDKSIRILDIGCGYGQNLRALLKLGYTNLQGIDLDTEAIEFCKSLALPVNQMDLFDFINQAKEKYLLCRV